MNRSILSIEKAEDYWINSDFLAMNKSLDSIDQLEINRKMEGINLTLFSEFASLNKIVLEINKYVNDFDNAKNLINYDNKTFPLIRNMINNHNSLVFEFKNRDSISNKKIISARLAKVNDELSQQILIPQFDKIFFQKIDADILSEMICLIGGNCQTKNNFSAILFEEININSTCASFSELNNLYLENVPFFKDKILEMGYPLSLEFNEDLQKRLNNIKRAVIKNREELLIKYLNDFPEQSSKRKIIQEQYLFLTPLKVDESYSSLNLTPALYQELVNLMPKSCDEINLLLPEVQGKELEESFSQTIVSFENDLFDVQTNESYLGNLELREIEPQCCTFNICKKCCITQQCIENVSTYPILFLHGHAVNKDLSADYSLEGFNQIQEMLEEDGYLNAGAITLYTSRNNPLGEWGLSGVPVTLRGSYYFDIFETPENYIITQAKSENIDTYAIRLKELIETVKYKTGKPKVTLMTFSMGGLVARRYMQLFGTSDINKAILIGAPNKGIVGEVADYCPLIGEKKECNDMNSESLFMKKLNNVPPPNIPFFNIIGTGCKMEGGLGDGAVLEDKAYLQGVKNFVIDGKCRSKVNPLHLDLRNLDLYPQVYEIIKEALAE